MPEIIDINGVLPKSASVSLSDESDPVLERLQEMASQIAYKGWCFEVARKDDLYILEVVTGKLKDWDDTRYNVEARRWRVLLDDNSDNWAEWLVDAAREMVIDIETHEVDEIFKFRGVRVYYPHPSLTARIAMVAACDPTAPKPK